MKPISHLLLTVILGLTVLLSPAMAADASGSLLINVTSSNVHKANMAISFSVAQLQQGQPLIILLNKQGVLLGSKANAAKFPGVQKTLLNLIDKGVPVMMSPQGMLQYGMTRDDVLPGILVGAAEANKAAPLPHIKQMLTW
ncbi:DsrE/DsrF-like family protein [Celerinatantimonas sp. YJH-8]|uniref:DsrE/DsrF-like family protein n=1 Tax=Celerinatantimonas sp. YJH-8 TaxID=3228714 RepID=UPI0038C136AA